MGNVEAGVNVGHQRVAFVPHPVAENAKALQRLAAPLNVVKMMEGQVGSQAGAQHRHHIFLGPIEDLFNLRPVGFLGQVAVHRIGAGENYGVQARLP